MAFLLYLDEVTNAYWKKKGIKDLEDVACSELRTRLHYIQLQVVNVHVLNPHTHKHALMHALTTLAKSKSLILIS